ncbi:MAG: FAD-dependent oxidoreductase [Candidatus Schekmanbacteria bacterium]|nr:FAD-dependent oxidoreductase [Candidatus Schekmanbacteria bacterium]
MAHQDCDVIIIGAGIGGLTAGALLARKGKRVVILEQNSLAGGKLSVFERGDYLFQTTCSLFNGFELGGIHERIMAQLDMLLTKQNQNPVWQLILPNHRVNVYNERIALLDELKREFPQAGDKMKNLFQRADEIENGFFDMQQHKNFFCPTGLKEKYIYHRDILPKLTRLTGGLEKKGADLLTLYGDDQEFVKLLDLPIFFHSLLGLKECPLLLAAYILGIPKRGAVYFPGGNQRLIKNLIKSLENNGGKIRYDCRVKKIIVESNQAVGVQLAGGENLRAKEIIANTAIGDLYANLLDDPNLLAKISKKTELFPRQWMPFSVYLGVDEDVLPDQLRDNVFLCNDYQKPIGDTHTLFINISPNDDPERAPQGKRALTVTAYLPFDKWQYAVSSADNKLALTKEIIRELSRFLVFIEDGISFQDSSPIPKQPISALWPQGLLSGLSHTPGGFGFNGYSNYTHYKHLWLVGEDSFPGRGSNLISLSALNLADIICQG